jgi:hypothetical protein
MQKTCLFRIVAKNSVPLILLLAIACVMAFFIAGDIINMQGAKTGYDYCLNLCYLVSNIGICYFMSICFMMLYLTYINKQYSKWTIRLFYVLGLSSLAYFAVSGHVYDYVFHHVENNFMEKLPSLARTIFTGPVYWIIIGYFFIPKILKDAQKMKEEQKLTV